MVSKFPSKFHQRKPRDETVLKIIGPYKAGLKRSKQLYQGYKCVLNKNSIETIRR